MARKISGCSQWREFFASVDTFLFDCDGVLWVGDADAVPGAKEAVAYVRSQGKRICFVSNNSSKSRKEYLVKLKAQGIEAYENEIFPTSYVVAHYLRHTCNFTGKAYVLGKNGLVDELRLQGIESIGSGPDTVYESLSELMCLPLDPEVSAVVVGLDPHFSFKKLIKATSYLANPDCLFIASNEDSRLPTKGPVIIPGTGCFVVAVKTAAGREPVVVGKPHKPMMDCIAQTGRFDCSRTVMIGDRLSTDIHFGRKFGTRTLLVLTGITKESDLTNLPSDVTPELYTDSIADLLQCVK